MADVELIGDSEFEIKVLESSKPVMVDFSGEWCPPCKMIAPFVTKIAKEFKNKINVYMVDVDRSPNIAATYQIMSIPALLFFKDGKPISSIIGAVPYNHIHKKVMEVLEV